MKRIGIDLDTQQLTLFDDRGDVLGRWPVSTAKNGAGEQDGSGCTPRGRHIVRAKIGAGASPDTIFVGRRPQPERYSTALAERFPEHDWILARILWLSGCERGVNRLGKVDTMRRYIYIHGTPPELALGVPLSHGCIRMHPEAVIDLFDRVDVGTPVDIVAT
jgi:lipoprotein-anchoring transpeptidase ErfK/SrfK